MTAKWQMTSPFSTTTWSSPPNHHRNGFTEINEGFGMDHPESRSKSNAAPVDRLEEVCVREMSRQFDGVWMLLLGWGTSRDEPNWLTFIEKLIDFCREPSIWARTGWENTQLHVCLHKNSKYTSAERTLSSDKWSAGTDGTQNNLLHIIINCRVFIILKASLFPLFIYSIPISLSVTSLYLFSPI